MNRPGKHSEVAIDGMPAARVAGEEEMEAQPDEVKPRKPVARPLDVATRLLQLVSLFVLFVFGLVGASIFTLRHTGMSHPALQRSTSLVVNRLAMNRGETHGNALRYSPPVYFSLVAMRQHGSGQEAAIVDVAKRFAPDFLVLDAQKASSIKQALPDHACVATERGSTDTVCYDRSIWSQRERGVHGIGMKDAHPSTRVCEWEVSWARFEREVSTRSTLAFHGRHWRNETLTVASVRERAVKDADCDREASLSDIISRLQGSGLSPQAPIVITDLPSPSHAMSLVDPFEHLDIVRSRPLDQETGAPPVLANDRMRPVSAAVLSFPEAPSSGSPPPVSVVYELLPPLTQT